MWFLLLLFTLVHSLSRGNLKTNVVLPFPITIDGVELKTSLSLDSNWRWIHNKESSTNCFSSGWDARLCPDSATCSKQCVIEGVPPEEWAIPYGVSTSGNSARLNYVTKGPYGTNYGSRLYVVNPTGKSYEGFDLRGKEVVFTVDVSHLPCGLNGAVYLTEMPLNNPYDNDLDAGYGVNYGDAQCPKDIKYVEGNANLGTLGVCANEYDLWEANSRSSSMALHPCKITGVVRCDNDKDCGVGANRHKGVCDKDGADYNPNRYGDRTLYGPGPSFSIDTFRPFDVVTQFIGNASEIHTVQRLFRQDGKTVAGGTVTAVTAQKAKKAFGEPDHFTELGGFKTMSESFARKHVLILSLWDDTSVHMRWLDSVYPLGSTKPYDYRGPCAAEDNSPDFLRRTKPDSYVVYSNIRINTLASGPEPPVTPEPNPCPPAAPAPVCPPHVPPPTPEPCPPAQTIKQWVCANCVYV